MFESQVVPPTSPHVAKNSPNWGIDVEIAVCAHCHWRYLIPREAGPDTCPNCYAGPLSGLPDLSDAYQPELIVPFNLPEHVLAQTARDFAASIPFAPTGLNGAALQAQWVPVYLPVWLVDGSVNATWEAEAGFNYEVVSHQEAYNGDQHAWQSREVKEPRTRWENRLGRLTRKYQNVTAPAIDDARQIEEKMGTFDLGEARSFDQDFLSINGRQACIRLPDHPPKEAWSETAAAFQKAAAAEVQQACAADRLRQFRWNARYSGLNWTLMLLPQYSACYLDDDGQPQPIHIHGQTGRIYGVLKASMRRARRTSLFILITGLLLLLAGLLLDSLSTSSFTGTALSTYLSILGIAGILASAVPLLIAWDFNRRQALEQARIEP